MRELTIVLTFLVSYAILRLMGRSNQEACFAVGIIAFLFGCAALHFGLFCIIVGAYMMWANVDEGPTGEKDAES